MMESQVLNTFSILLVSDKSMSKPGERYIIRQYKSKSYGFYLQSTKKLVKTLDNFDAVCNDLNIGLPAEINARKKQYEYYRDFLLTFVQNGDSIKKRREEKRREEKRREEKRREEKRREEQSRAEQSRA